VSHRNATADGMLVEGARSVQGATRDVLDTVVTGTQAGMERWRDFVVERPVKAALVVATFGLVLGYLLGRSSS
jgi:ElaB/YqjD/DUF883 family membrane-anchored ribosome-binding protein